MEDDNEEVQLFSTTKPEEKEGKALKRENQVVPVTDFNDLKCFGWLKVALGGMKLQRPTLIQQNTIPAALAGRNVVGASPTGSGKTLCFAVPILQSLATDPYGIHSLVLTPTRELAFQIADQFRALGSKISVRVQVLVGGMDSMQQAQTLIQIPHILIATPGRLLEFLSLNTVKGFTLRRIKFLVMDEADRLLSIHFQDDLEEILQLLPSIKMRQTLLFSATMTPNLQRLGTLPGMENSFFYDATHTNLFSLPPTLQSEFILVPPPVRRFADLTSIIVFVSTKGDCEAIHVMLQDLEFSTTHLHSFMRQEERNRTLNQIKSGLVQILVSTDIASRGLDIPTVSLVINYNVPQQTEDFVHRVGRTARAGREGKAITMVVPSEVKFLLDIEKNTGKKMEEFEHSEEDALLYLNKALTARQVAILHLNDIGFTEKLEKFDEARREQKEEKKQARRKRNQQRRQQSETEGTTEEKPPEKKERIEKQRTEIKHKSMPTKTAEVSQTKQKRDNTLQDSKKSDQSPKQKRDDTPQANKREHSPKQKQTQPSPQLQRKRKKSLSNSSGAKKKKQKQ